MSYSNNDNYDDDVDDDDDVYNDNTHDDECNDDQNNNNDIDIWNFIDTQIFKPSKSTSDPTTTSPQKKNK